MENVSVCIKTDAFFFAIVYDNSVWVTELRKWKYNDPRTKEVS
jgi:hypothetical protein